MKRKKRDDLHKHVWMLTLIFGVLGVSTAGVHGEEVGDRDDYQHGSAIRRLLATNETTTASPPEEDKSIWEEIEEFYSDDNNMAMYCVLPLIILIYGGCAAIYCIHKCRLYIRRRRYKRMHGDRETLVEQDETNDLNQEGGNTLNGGERQPIKTVSGNAWDDPSRSFADVNGYNVQGKKTPLPWDTPQKTQDNFTEPREDSYSAGSSESRAAALERERDKLERNMEDNLTPRGGTEIFVKEKETRPKPPPFTNPPPPPAIKTNDGRRTANPKPLQIVPITALEYQQHMESQNALWDPLHNRPFESRASMVGGGGGGGGETGRRSGRESSWSIRDEIMAKYDALTSLAMAKKTADVLRVNSQNPNLDGGHHPDTMRRKPGKKKLIFIAE